MEDRRSFSKAFKIEAVRLLDLGEMSAAQLARELGVRRAPRRTRGRARLLTGHRRRGRQTCTRLLPASAT